MFVGRDVCDTEFIRIKHCTGWEVTTRCHHIVRRILKKRDRGQQNVKWTKRAAGINCSLCKLRKWVKVRIKLSPAEQRVSCRRSCFWGQISFLVASMRQSPKWSCYQFLPTYATGSEARSWSSKLAPTSAYTYQLYLSVADRYLWLSAKCTSSSQIDRLRICILDIRWSEQLKSRKSVSTWYCCSTLLDISISSKVLMITV